MIGLAPAFAQAPRTLRLDFYHTGTATTEVFSVDRVVIEPTPWPGNPQRPIDDTNFGKYFFEVIDRASNRVLYSRGFASIFGEWETTGEAKGQARTFQESLRFPTARRRRAGGRQEARCGERVQGSVVHARRSGRSAHRSCPARLARPARRADEERRSGEQGRFADPRRRIHRRASVPKFEKDARRLVDLLFGTSPFKERRQDFNVWGLCPPAAESGISRPSTGKHRRSPVGATYDAFGSERYVLTFDNRQFRDIASFAPYDVVEIVANDRTYGGGGIFNLYATVAVDNQWAPYVFVHEFGHHFAGLADEYYTSEVAYLPAQERVEPWEANATALVRPGNS